MRTLDRHLRMLVVVILKSDSNESRHLTIQLSAVANGNHPPTREYQVAALMAAARESVSVRNWCEAISLRTDNITESLILAQN